MSAVSKGCLPYFLHAVSVSDIPTCIPTLKHLSAISCPTEKRLSAIDHVTTSMASTVVPNARGRSKVSHRGVGDAPLWKVGTNTIAAYLCFCTQKW